MAEKKGWGSTVVGWFIESDEEPPPTAGKDDADALIKKYGGDDAKPAGKPIPPRPPGPDNSPARSPSGETPPDFGGGAPAGGANVDFDAVFRKAGIEAEEADRVAKALALLDQLPAETPLSVKKQIVETSLKAFGVPIESIIETAVAEIESLHACIQAGAGEAQALAGDSEKRIAKLEAEIADIRKVTEARWAEQRGLEAAARVRGLTVQRILEFFGQEKVGQVVKESPRLSEPPKGS